MSYKFFLPNPSYNHDGVSFAIKLCHALWKDQGVLFYEYTEINDYETCNGSNTPKCLTLTEYGEGGVLSSHKDLYTERFSGFMLNGGVTALQRHGLRPDGTYGTVDNLSITYDGNMVQSVSDAAPAITQPGSMDYPGGSSGNVFSYNSWGALEKDTGRGITSVTYDYLGNPQQISYSDQSYTRHVYSSSGDKLKSVHHSTPSLLSLAAMDGTATKAVSAAAGQETFEYRGPVIYRNGAVHMVLFPGGYATISGSTVTFHYYTQDYLGNNRAVVNGSTGAIEQTTAYYPYGGVIADLDSGNSGQPFKFGGKELVTANGLNEYDFGARRYFQAIPHFTSIDPLCEKYYWLSPYLYCANDPVNAIDPDGREILFINGLIAFGAPSAGKAYWNGEESSFVSGAKKYFKDANAYFIEYDPNVFSNAFQRKQDGYSFAKENYTDILSNMKEGESVKIVAHSMGCAYSEGIAAFLTEQGIPVSELVYINAYQAGDITTISHYNKGCITIDYQNTDDPVINYIPFSSSGDIKGANYKIREKTNDNNFLTKHRSPIDQQGYLFWEKLANHKFNDR